MTALRFAFLAFIPLIPLIQARVDALAGSFRAQEAALYVWSGEQVARLSPGFRNLMADMYWLRTVQYYGGQRVYDPEKRFDLLLPLVTITTTLDPRLEIAYSYGATFLAEAWPIGAGRPKDAIELLEQGVRRNPRYWRLWQELGLFHFYFLRDTRRAAEIFRQASSLPGAPFWMGTLAAKMLEEGGERKASRALWRQIYETTEPGPLQNNALVHLGILKAMDDVDAHRRSVAEFNRRFGRPPRYLGELARVGLLRAPVADPTGVPYGYDPHRGEVWIGPSMLHRPELIEGYRGPGGHGR